MYVFSFNLIESDMVGINGSSRDDYDGPVSFEAW